MSLHYRPVTEDERNVSDAFFSEIALRDKNYILPDGTTIDNAMDAVFVGHSFSPELTRCFKDESSSSPYARGVESLCSLAFRSQILRMTGPRPDYKIAITPRAANIILRNSALSPEKLKEIKDIADLFLNEVSKLEKV